MKKILLLLFAFVALGVVINSCISELVPEPEPEPYIPEPEDPELVLKKTFSLFFNTAQIKAVNNQVNTYANPYLGLSTPLILWGSSEYAGVFMMGDDNTTLYQNRQYNINDDRNASGSRSALLIDTITTNMLNATSYGYYPYQSSLTLGTTVSYQLDSVQNQSANNTSKNVMDYATTRNLFMIAPVTDSYKINGGTCVLAFETVFSILRFQVTRTSDPTFVLDGQRVQQAQLYIADKSNLNVPLNYNLAGDYTIDISKAVGTSGYQGPVFIAGKGANKVTASVTGGNPITQYDETSPYVWFIVNPVTIKSNECLVAIFETDRYRIISTFDVTELKANNVYILPVEAKQSNTVSDVIIATYFPKAEASNCYVVPHAGICQIPLFKISGEALRGATVDWLWASKENGGAGFDIKELIDPATIVYSESATNENDNYVSFRVGSDFGRYTKGNVILALKNANGDVVWTWHIWITDDLKDLMHNGGFMFLDRNIGALSPQMGATPVDNFGFVYQWGRKDPFMGGDGKSNEATTAVMSVANANSIVNNADKRWPNRSTTMQTADFARLNPMTFICNNVSPAPPDGEADWLSGGVTTRWSENDKTDNDPCPVGYRVPNKNEMMTLHSAVETNITNLLYFRNSGNYHWTYFYDCHCPFDITNTTWPAAGMRQGRFAYKGNVGAQLISSGTAAVRGSCVYWTSTPFNAYGSYRIYTANTTIYSEDEYGDNADAYSIRCVQE